MATVPLSPDAYRRLIDLLVRRADLHTQLARRTLLAAAGLARFEGRLPLEATTEGFATELVALLQRQGILPETGEPALVSLLRELRELLAGHESDATFLDQLLALTQPPPPTPEQRTLIAHLQDISRSPSERSEAGQRLAALGDPRPGVGLRADGIPDIAWIEIPAGSAVIGADEATYQAHRNGPLPPLLLTSEADFRSDKGFLEYRHMLPPQTPYLPAFWMAKYPVTHRQFQAFVDDPGGYRNGRWWRDLERDGELEEAAFPHANHPRDRVSWYEAVAFCRWLSTQLGYEVRLPSEVEWEKTARGPGGWLYPWGNRYRSGYANIDEAAQSPLATFNMSLRVGPHYLGHTTPVGMYPQGASPYGVLDLAGNVQEWTRSEHEGGLTELFGKGRRWRGGSWQSDARRARATYCGGYHPTARSDDTGFRVLTPVSPH